MLDPTDVATFSVVQPNVVLLTPFALAGIDPGVMGASMLAKITLGPADVSFYNIQIREESGPASGAQGFFKQFPVNVPPPNGLFHKASENWDEVSQQNVVVLTDASGHAAVLPDHLAIVGYGERPWGDGSFQLLIPWRYRAQGETAPHDIVTLQTTFDLIGGSGTVTIKKAGACVTRKADETASHDCSRPP
jgi:hypothetical protein